jgi:hypothetical protein
MSKPRKPVSSCIDGAGVVVVCDDGAVFIMPSPEVADSIGKELSDWLEGKPIPGSARDIEQQNKSNKEKYLYKTIGKQIS